MGACRDIGHGGGGWGGGSGEGVEGGDLELECCQLVTQLFPPVPGVNSVEVCACSILRGGLYGVSTPGWIIYSKTAESRLSRMHASGIEGSHLLINHSCVVEAVSY